MPAHRTKENQGIVATESRHTVEGMARGERKKKKPLKKKAPNKKRENAACGSSCLRAAAPPSSLASLPLLPLPMAAAPPHTLSSRLSLASPSPSSYGGCAATPFLPSPRLSRLLWAAAPTSLFSRSPLSRGSASRRRPLLPAYLFEAKNIQKRRHKS